MKIQLILVASTLTMALAAGCSPASEAGSSSTPESAQSPEAAPALPTPQEEAAKAAEAIQPSNAEEELARLQAELAGG